ncbi:MULTISPECIES: DUF2155 domain-containing protein [unclassified Sulfitobacter]|jgi:hypothetical protein|uniref:DUF2155 domain-containing protein n=1 Tax=unclassified Sulfitobacter TaxID=196795 RepID=UPI001594C568|nr:DUF2155 domain-containing protein [Sulfitobacter sp. HGT1]MBQ0803583.1 DUF2155 domain-containing protein [Sulfitobacter sp.]
MRKILIMLALLAAPVQAQQVTSANGAVLRALDKISGTTKDYEMVRGQIIRVGNLEVQMNDCRFPSGNPAGDAFAELEIREEASENRLFSGWMIASAPALSALEHPRYDIWVIRCTTS